MSLILHNNLSYDDIKILNNIANYNDNLQITNNNLYKYNMLNLLYHDRNIIYLLVHFES